METNKRIPHPEVGKEDSSLSSLQQRNEQLEKTNRRTQFISVLCIVILIDFLLFPTIANWAGALVIGLFQLILLLFVGRMLGIEDIDTLITRILTAYSRGDADSAGDRK